MWRKNRNTGRMVPVNLSPATDGNGNVRVISADEVVIVGKGKGTHVLHFATCPNADEHRKSRTA